MKLTRKNGCGIQVRQLWLLLGIQLITMPLAAATFRVYVANYAGGTVDIIDPATNKVVQSIQDLQLPHGVRFSPDGKRVYVSSEGDKVLNAFDRETGKLIKKVPLSGTPNNITVAKDGGRVFVAIADPPGALDIVDTNSLEKAKTIPMKGPLHNIYVTPDGKYVDLGSVLGKSITMLDAKTEKPVWEINFEHSVMNQGIDRNPDGSTRHLYVTLSDVRGFAVVDFSQHKVVDQIDLPPSPSGTPDDKHLNPHIPCHGIGVAPDNKTLWINSRWDETVFVYSLPDLKPVGHVRIGVYPEWLTFSPDSKLVYDSNRGENTVSVIDAKMMKEITRIPVGETPARIDTVVVR